MVKKTCKLNGNEENGDKKTGQTKGRIVTQRMVTMMGHIMGRMVTKRTVTKTGQIMGRMVTQTGHVGTQCTLFLLSFSFAVIVASTWNLIPSALLYGLIKWTQ